MHAQPLHERPLVFRALAGRSRLALAGVWLFAALLAAAAAWQVNLWMGRVTVAGVFLMILSAGVGLALGLQLGRWFIRLRRQPQVSQDWVLIPRLFWNRRIALERITAVRCEAGGWLILESGTHRDRIPVAIFLTAGALQAFIGAIREKACFGCAFELDLLDAWGRRSVADTSPLAFSGGGPHSGDRMNLPEQSAGSAFQHKPACRWLRIISGRQDS